jgi:hypothetical protein
MAPLIGGQSNAEEIRRGQRIERPHNLSGGAHQNVASPAMDMAIVAALVSLGVVYWVARRTMRCGGTIWGIPI